MKVTELRKLLGEADRERMEKAFVESYKSVPKAKKEELDLLITSILEGKDLKKGDKNENLDFDALEREITIFLENAYAQNYFAPNRVIPKNQRPKWRFIVKGYLKQLEKIPAESEYHPRAVKALRELYHMLCYGCSFYIFSTDDTFRSIGWEQPKVFQMLVKKTFSQGYSKEDIRQMVLDGCTGGLSRECLHEEMMIVLLGELRTSDVKYLAIEAAKELVAERKDRLKTLKKHDYGQYDLKEAVNKLCGMILMLSIELGDTEDGVNYFFRTSMEYSKEITLFVALRYVDFVGDDRVWMWIYEYGVKKGIEPREQLRREYEEMKRELEKGEKE